MGCLKLTYHQEEDHFLEASPLRISYAFGEVREEKEHEFLGVEQGGHWSDQYASSSYMSAGDFINSALNSQYGGSWSNGQAHYFTSDEEGFFAGVAYNNYHNSWGNTEYGSAAASLVAFGIIRSSGQMPTRDEVQNVLNPSRLNVYASASSAAVGDPWYVWAWRMYAGYLRETPMFGTTPNPFYGAVALYVDGCWSFVGAEGDAGVFFILSGKEIGKVLSFTEIAGGGATDAGLGVELGRIDFMGNPLQFKSADLYGLRDKVWLSVSPVGEFVSVGGAFAWSSTQEGIKVYASSIQLSLGV